MTIPLNQGEHTNLMNSSLNKRENQMMEFPLNKRENTQTLLKLSLNKRDKGTQLITVMRTLTKTIYLHHQLGIHVPHIHHQLGTHSKHIDQIWSNYHRTQRTPRSESEDHTQQKRR